jgi:hypothetical protein
MYGIVTTRGSLMCLIGCVYVLGFVASPLQVPYASCWIVTLVVNNKINCRRFELLLDTHEYDGVSVSKCGPECGDVIDRRPALIINQLNQSINLVNSLPQSNQFQ